MNREIKMVQEYWKPICVIEKSANVHGVKALFKNNEDQIYFKESNVLTCIGGGYIILDFGMELHGGIRILENYVEGEQEELATVRIRFGESVGEACAELGEKNAGNAHSIRDMEVVLPDVSDMTFGQTGFRFVRLDFLNPNKTYRIVNIYAQYIHRDLEYKGKFVCNDALVNEIYNTAKHTIFLNMQTNLWEGIKRDRMVWIGDMQPEVLAITDLFGEDICVEKALEKSIEKNPLPCWFGNIPAYSFWLIQIFYDYYMKVKNTTFVKNYLPYIDGILSQLNECVSEDGDIDYTKGSAYSREGYFLDWPTYKTLDSKAGNRYVFLLVLRSLKKLYVELKEVENPLVEVLLHKLQQAAETKIISKQVVALGYLSGRISKEEAQVNLYTGGAKGLSTYMSYFIFKAMAESGNIDQAMELMKEYYGGMLSVGATSFWEDFDVEWIENSGRIDERTPEGKKDIHGDFGRFCYEGYRHSLCHGWSCGPVQFLTENVLGVTVVEAGCKTIQIRPELGKLQWVEGDFPTPYGIVHIRHEKQGDKVVSTWAAPKEVKVIR